MRTTYKAGLFLCLLLCLAAPLHARAQDGTQDSAEASPAEENKRKLMQFAANNAEFDTRVESEAKALFTRQIVGCTKIDQAVRQLPTPYAMLQFPGGKLGNFPAPTHGIWAEHVKLRACNKVWQINMLAAARPDGKQPLLLTLLPGTTLADPVTQIQAERMGATTIRKADGSSCADDAVAYNSELLGFLQPDKSVGKTNAGAGWFEEWTFKYCQRMVPVQMAFTPDAKGGYEVRARLTNKPVPQTPAAKPEAPASAE